LPRCLFKALTAATDGVSIARFCYPAALADFVSTVCPPAEAQIPDSSASLHGTLLKLTPPSPENTVAPP
jgi:hypothetical protein